MSDVKQFSIGGETIMIKDEYARQNKADKAVGAVAGNLANLDSDGNPVDSDIPSTKIAEIESKVLTLGNSAGIAECIADSISAGTAQEIVFRKSGGDGVNYMKAIKGKTLVWNQLVHNGNFADGTTGWTVGFGTRSADGNILTYSVTEPTNSPCITQGSFPDIVNHKYLFAAEFNYSTKPTSTQTGFLGIGGYYGPNWRIQDIVPNSWFRVSGIVTSTGLSPTKDLRIYLRTTGMSVGDTVQLKNIVAFDLTLMFGAGNEPSTVEEFEAMFPLSYYPYNAGTLISNDASEIEAVGFNQFDESTFIPGWRDNNGAEYETYTNRRLSRVYFPCLPNKSYHAQVLEATGQEVVCICWYDANKEYISGIQQNANGNGFNTTSPANAAYFLIATTATNENICINLSDASKNGTYEPYWKRKIELGLNSFKVKSHNIWDEEWENGNIDGTTGENTPDSTCIRSTNYINVTPGAVYYFCNKGQTSYIAIRFRCYDENKTFVPDSVTRYWNNAITIPNGVHYIRFSCLSGYGTTYNHDICINLSSSFNGQYEPYGDITVNGLKSAGSVYDEIKDGKYIKRIGEVDLGSLGFRTDASGFSVIFPDAKTQTNNIICGRYSHSFATNMASQEDKSIRISTVGTAYIIIKDSAYSDVNQFIASLSGVMAHYELATPVEFELAEPIPNSILVDELGTEQAIFPTHEDGSPSAPLCTDSNYSISVKNLVAKLKSLNNS